MKLIHRIGYYLGGFSIGLILLAFFLGGKKTSCTYGPNARTIKNISIKKRKYSETANNAMHSYQIDTLEVSRLIQNGEVNFSESDTKNEGCKTYVIESDYENKQAILTIENCDSLAILKTLLIQ